MLRAMCVGAMLLCGCRTPEPATVAPASAQAAEPRVDEELERCLADQRRLYALNLTMRTDPVAAFRDIGIDVELFDPIARLLYQKWLEKHPEARPRPVSTPTPQSPAPVVTHAPAPDPAPSEVSGPGDDISWWCYRSTKSEWGECEATKAKCNEMRAEYVNWDFTPCPPNLGKQRCADIAAGVQGVGACIHQNRAACFGKYYVLQKVSDLGCAPTIASCKARRENSLKRFSDDIRVTSECKPRD